jgi:hypothetical protein
VIFRVLLLLLAAGAADEAAAQPAIPPGVACADLPGLDLSAVPAFAASGGGAKPELFLGVERFGPAPPAPCVGTTCAAR